MQIHPIRQVYRFDMASAEETVAAADKSTKLSKSERKLAKKQAKAYHTLLKHDGIRTVTNPMPILLVSNGGLGNGIERSEIQKIFSSVGLVEDVVMLREKPYCFVKYGYTSLALSAMQRLHGHCLREGQGPANVTLYLSFVESVPNDRPQTNHPPPGLVVIPDFIDECLEHELTESIDWGIPSETVNQSLKHRKVKHHGYEFNYSTNNVDREMPLPGGMPELYEQVINRIMETGHVMFKPDQLTINQYQPGQGIPPHVDTHSAFEDAIISLSLGSQVVMEFTHPDGHQVPIVLPRRSLLIMKGEARYKWTHGITPKKTDVVPDPTSPENLTLQQRGQRTSFTFRAVRKGPCDCKYPEQCDSQKFKTETVSKAPQVVYPKSEDEAAKLEAEQVHVVYNNIAQHFSGTRYKPWPKVVDFLNRLAPGSVVLDVGCGNGKYLGVNKDLHMMGCDRSNQLIDICRARSLEGLVCDSLALPFGDGRVDACICIAVIHHMSTRARRLQALREITRVLCPGGLALVTVWAMEQERKKEKSKYISKTQETSNGSSGDHGGSSADETRCSKTSYTEASKGCDLSEGTSRSDNHEIGSDEKTGCKRLESNHQSGLCAYPADIAPHEPEDVIRNDGTNCSVRSGIVANNGGRSGIPENNSVMSGTYGKKSVSSVIDQEQQTSCTEVCDQPSLQTETTNSSQQQFAEGATSKTDKITEKPSGETIIVHKNRTQFEQQDLLVPWHLRGQRSKATDNPGDNSKSKDKEEVFYRYYHVFVEGEMEELCQTVQGVKVEETYYDQGNWCVIFKKV